MAAPLKENLPLDLTQAIVQIGITKSGHCIDLGLPIANSADQVVIAVNEFIGDARRIRINSFHRPADKGTWSDPPQRWSDNRDAGGAIDRWCLQAAEPS